MNAAPALTATLLLKPDDPLVFRDARPFSADPGAYAETLPWPLPQTVAGALRTHIGPPGAASWTAEAARAAKRIGVHNLLALDHGGGYRPFAPAPADAVWHDAPEAGPPEALRPLGPYSSGQGSDLPHPTLEPLVLKLNRTGKPQGPLPHFWSLGAVAAWLAATAAPALAADDHSPGLLTETRVHVAIDAATGAGRAGMLFATTGLHFPREPAAAKPTAAILAREPADIQPAAAILVRVLDAPPGWQPAAEYLALGGDRRAVAVEPASASLWPAFSPGTPPAGGRRLRLYLATPALFSGGWRPGWLDAETLEGSPSWLPEVPRLKLVAAAIGRRIPVSGWDMQARGPKATRYAVPGGSVYFFEVANQDAMLTEAALRALWLTSISDDTPAGPDPAQDRHDGYGLALPGIW